LVKSAFSKGAIMELESLVHETAEPLVRALTDAGTADLLAGLAIPLPLSVICSVIGASPGDASQLKTWSKSWAALTHNRSLTSEEQVRHAEGLLAWQRFMGRLVEARRVAPRNDLMSRLLEAREEGVVPLTVPEIAVFSMGLLFAGHETTTNLIANTVLHCIEKGVWPRLENDAERVRRAIEETLRFDPPVQGMIRRATQDTELVGIKIPKGQQVFLSFASANRDESRYGDPDRFDIDREDPPPHLGFGYGIHFCLGAQLARMEAQVALSALASASRAPRLVDAELRYHPSLVHRGPERLRVAWS
jgi:cytochrome P450